MGLPIDLGMAADPRPYHPPAMTHIPTIAHIPAHKHRIGHSVRTEGHVRIRSVGGYRKVHLGIVVDRALSEFGGQCVYKLSTRYGTSDWVNESQLVKV
jgi:hypothetical protein